MPGAIATNEVSDDEVMRRRVFKARWWFLWIAVNRRKEVAKQVVVYAMFEAFLLNPRTHSWVAEEPESRDWVLELANDTRLDTLEMLRLPNDALFNQVLRWIAWGLLTHWGENLPDFPEPMAQLFRFKTKEELAEFAQAQYQESQANGHTPRLPTRLPKETKARYLKRVNKAAEAYFDQVPVEEEDGFERPRFRAHHFDWFLDHQLGATYEKIAERVNKDAKTIEAACQGMKKMLGMTQPRGRPSRGTPS